MTKRYDPPEDQLRRVCRMYHSTRDAAKALGISPKHLLTLLKRHGMTPSWKLGVASPSAGMTRYG